MSLPTSTTVAPARHRPSPFAVVATIVCGLLLLAAGVFLAVVGGHLLDVMRRGSLVSIDSPNAGTAEFLFPIPVPILALFLAGLAYRWANHKASGRTDRWVGASPWTLAFVGLTIGIWYSRLQWAPADKVGSTFDVSDKIDVPWVWQEWALYSLEFWVAPVITIISIALLVGDRFGGRKLDARRALAQQLLDAGSVTPGTVTFLGEQTPGQRVYYIEWEVQFEAAGAARSIRRTEAFPWRNPPTQGQRVTVLFDPAAPDDDDRTFVSLGAGRDADEYLRAIH